MQKNLRNSLFILGMVATAIPACSKKNDDSAFRAQTAAAEAEKAKYNTLSNETNAKKAELDAELASTKAIKQALAMEQMSYAQQRKSREDQILKFDGQIKTLSQQSDAASKALAQLIELSKKEQAHIDAAKADLAKERETLSADQAKNKEVIASLDARDKELSNKQGQLDTLSQSIKDSQAAIVIQNSELVKEKEAFAANIQAARDLFLKENAGDVFDGMDKNKDHSFLITVRGMGSVKNIKSIRSAIAKFNVAAKKADNNKNSNVNPVIKNASDVKIGDELIIGTSNLIEGEKGERTFIAENESQTTDVRDSMIVTGTPLEIQQLRDSLNKSMKSLEKQEGAHSVSLFVIARPIRNVRVGLKMSLFGSAQAKTEKREIKEFMTMGRIRPLDADVSNFETLDAKNLEREIFNSKGSLASCNVIGAECLAMLKKLGLLDQPTSITYTNEDGKQITENTTYAGYIEQKIRTSILRIRMEDALRNQGNEFSANLRIKYENSSWFEQNILGKDPIKYTIDETEIKQKIQELSDDLVKATAFLNERILEKITLEYNVTMVDSVSDSSNPLDSMDYMTAILDGGVTLKSIESFSRGELEIPLPIKTSMHSESKFENLTLSDVKQAVAPVQPVRPKLDMQISHEMSSLYMEFRQFNKAIDESKLTAAQKEELKALKAYDAALTKYTADRKQYEIDIKTYEENKQKSNTKIYDERAQNHASDLRQILKAMGEVK